MNGLMQEFEKDYSVLVVDDTDIIRQFVSTHLRRGNVQIKEAVNGKEALAAYKELEPDLIVTDIVMPEMDGLTLTKKIREMNLSVPIIVMSSEPVMLGMAVEHGANSILPKPINADVLLGMVDSLLNCD